MLYPVQIRGYRRALFLAACVLEMGVISVSAALTDGLLFSSDFDGSPSSATYAQGKSTAEGAIVRSGGVQGKGAQTGVEGIRFSAPGNFQYSRGTISLWIHFPELENSNNASQSKYIRIFEIENFMIRYDPPGNNLFFMTGKTVSGEGYKWDYGCVAQPGKNFTKKWTHVAATWDTSTGKKELYLDGVLRAEDKTNIIRDSIPGMEVGFVMGGGSEKLQFDDVYIWNRVLDSKEVVEVCQNYEKLETEARQLPSANFVSTTALEIGLNTIPAGQVDKATIVAPKESCLIYVPITNTAQVEWIGEATFVCEDFFGHECATHRQKVTLPADSKTVLKESFSSETQGIYRISLRLAGGGGPERIQDVASFVVWPTQSALSDSSWFGVHVNSWSNGEYVRQAARLGFRWNRDHNMLQTTWWPRVQPEQGEFQWLHEPSLKANLDAGMQVLGQIFGTPWWAAARGELPRQKVTAGDSAYPYGAQPKKAEFATYVTRTVEHYKDRIHLWEVWNEPDVSMFWNGSPEAFAELVQIATKSIKQADPSAKVMAAGNNAGWRFAEAMAKAGALRGLDALSIHLYHSPNESPEQLFAKYETAMTFWHGLSKNYSDNPNMPIYQSEGGSTSTTFLRGVGDKDWPPESVRPELNWRNAAIRQVQSDVFLKSLGLAASFSYLWNPGHTYENLSELDIDSVPKPKAVARAALAYQIDGLNFFRHIRRNEGRYWAFLFNKPNTKECVAVIWCGDKGKLHLQTESLKGLKHIANIMGAVVEIGKQVEITEVPVYLRFDQPAEVVAESLSKININVVANPVEIKQESVDAGKQAPNLPSLSDYGAPLENPGGIFLVDLKPLANMGLVDEIAGDGRGGWADEGPINDARDLPTGRLNLYGVPFTVINPKENNGHSIITLRGTRVAPTLPEKVEGIPVNHGNVRALYFLQAAVWGEPGKAGQYIVHYADDSSIEIPIVIGKNSGDWWLGYNKNEISKPWPFRIQADAYGKPSWRYLRVWEWENPKPMVPIKSVDFISANSSRTPILLGITGITW